MKRINSQNVVAFIQYLYETKLNRAPEAEVLNSWTGLQTENNPSYLTQLFNSWGYSTEQADAVITDFLTRNNPSSSSVPHANPLPPVTPPDFTDTTSDYPSSDLERKHRRGWLWILLPIILAGIFVAYRYQQFKNLHYLYVVTNNVTVRSLEGESLGRMDIFPRNGSFSYLKTTSDKTYPLEIKGKVYPYRQVVIDGVTTFKDFLLNRKSQFGYVNDNFVIDNEQNFILYRKIFKAVDKSKVEGGALSFDYRKVVVGSLVKAPELEDLYVTSPCDRTTSTRSNLLKFKAPSGMMQVVAQLSNGQYYIFTGDPLNKEYQAPVVFQYENYLTGDRSNFKSQSLTFISNKNSFTLADCEGNSLGYQAHFNSKGLIDYAQFVEQ